MNKDLQTLLRETNEMIDSYEKLPQRKQMKRKYREDYINKVKRKVRLEKLLKDSRRRLEKINNLLVSLAEEESSKGGCQ